jgi:type VI secretion system protein ImpM
MPLQFGFYGKLPSQGDFVSRRLPWEFTEAWDAWMAAGLAAARGELGEQWLQHYLNAPVWRFRLLPGVAGPQAWLGLWFASVDRVGRHFPLTVAAPLGTSPLAAATDGRVLAQPDEQWLALEDQALAALSPRTTLDAFDQLMQSVALEPPVGDAAPAAEPAERGATVLASDADLALAESACARCGTAPVLFFSWGSQSLPPVLLAADALPDATAFGAFLHGRWTPSASDSAAVS